MFFVVYLVGTEEVPVAAREAYNCNVVDLLQVAFFVIQHSSADQLVDLLVALGYSIE